VQAKVRDRAEHATLAGRLRDAGYPVIDGEQRPFAWRLRIPKHAREFSRQRRAALRALLDCEETAEMARRLRISDSSLNDYLQRIMEELGVHSRTRLIGRLLELGYLRMEATS
jgi:DNA-binding NarL/FixJ family response regulator